MHVPRLPEYFGKVSAVYESGLAFAMAHDADDKVRRVCIPFSRDLYRSFPDGTANPPRNLEVGDRIAMLVYNDGNEAKASLWCFREEVDAEQQRRLLAKKPQVAKPQPRPTKPPTNRQPPYRSAKNDSQRLTPYRGS